MISDAAPPEPNVQQQFPGEGGFGAAVRELPALCRGIPGELERWLLEPTTARFSACAGCILAGTGAYGFTLGLWRSPAMGSFVAAKLPLLIFLTLGVNATLNIMLGALLGNGLRARQTVLALLMSFAGFSLITGALSPITLGMACNAPGPGEPGAIFSYQMLLLVHTALITFAGITAHMRFRPLLNAVCGGSVAGRRVFLAWLAGNLFVGAQLSWNLRPFFGQPGRPVHFLRDDWNQGNFYESIGRAASGIAHAMLPGHWGCILLFATMFAFYRMIRHFSRSRGNRKNWQAPHSH